MLPMICCTAHLPPRRREDVLVFIIPMALHHLAGVRVLLLLCHVFGHPHVLPHMHGEQRTRPATCSGEDEVIEGALVRDDYVLLQAGGV